VPYVPTNARKAAPIHSGYRRLQSTRCEMAGFETAH
jgi:hypothetical protein